MSPCTIARPARSHAAAGPSDWRVIHGGKGPVARAAPTRTAWTRLKDRLAARAQRRARRRAARRDIDLLRGASPDWLDDLGLRPAERDRIAGHESPAGEAALRLHLSLLGR